MALLTRKLQKLFGSTGSLNQLSKFGSLAAGAPVRYSGATVDPDEIQALSNYLQGWFGAVIGNNSPAIEDMNSICYLFAYQLSYIFQEGVPEWNSATEYTIGSIAQDGLGTLFVSLQASNTNNVLTNGSWWRGFSATTNIVTINPATQSPYTITSSDIGKTFLVQSANGAMTFTLPAASINFHFTIKDRDGFMSTSNCTIARAGSESIEGLASSYVCASDFGIWNPKCNGTNWFLI